MARSEITVQQSRITIIISLGTDMLATIDELRALQTINRTTSAAHVKFLKTISKQL